MSAEPRTATVRTIPAQTTTANVTQAHTTSEHATPAHPARTHPAPSRAVGPGVRLAALAVVAAAVCALYLAWGLTGNWQFLIGRRALTVATMVVVAVAIGMSTVLFHAVTANRILTPSVMGLDALYLALQTAIVFALGAQGASLVAGPARFVLELAAMVGASVALFGLVMGRFGRSLTLLLLVGILLGGLLRGVSSFLQRIMAPQEFIVLQDRFFADFTGADPVLLGTSGVLVAVLGVLVWTRRHELDVVALGHDLAVCLGVRHRRVTMQALAIVALLVGVATALVGPTLFFGLLVAHLAYAVLGTDRHAWTLPGAALSGVIALVGGQFLFERVLGLEGSLSMVVEFVGGLLFIGLILRRTRS